MSATLDRRGLGLLGGAHLSVDLCQAAVPALLPFFVDQRGYSYAAAGALVFAATVGSSLIQPLFGHAADRLQLPWLMPAGVLAAGAGIALAGLASSYALTFAAIVLSGVGVAAFHPEGARHANYASGDSKAQGMSLFALGGNAGFALGPAAHHGLRARVRAARHAPARRSCPSRPGRRCWSSALACTACACAARRTRRRVRARRNGTAGGRSPG